MDQFAPSTDVSKTEGHTHWDRIDVVPTKLRKACGEGIISQNDPHMTRQWLFTKGNRTFSVYDWKSTSLFDPKFPTPEAFWNSNKPVSLHLCGEDDDAAEADVNLLIEGLEGMCGDKSVDKLAKGIEKMGK